MIVIHDDCPRRVCSNISRSLALVLKKVCASLRSLARRRAVRTRRLQKRLALRRPVRDTAGGRLALRRDCGWLARLIAVGPLAQWSPNTFFAYGRCFYARGDLRCGGLALGFGIGRVSFVHGLRLVHDVVCVLGGIRCIFVCVLIRGRDGLLRTSLNIRRRVGNITCAHCLEVAVLGCSFGDVGSRQCRAQPCATSPLNSKACVVRQPRPHRQRSKSAKKVQRCWHGTVALRRQKDLAACRVVRRVQPSGGASLQRCHVCIGIS